jgi:hypothetical protein
MRLEELTPGNSLTGIEPSAIATIVAVVPIAEGAVQVIYKTPDGTLKERLLGRADEAMIALATQERPWAFDGDGGAFKLAVEAKRIDLAFLFDPMMAVHTRMWTRCRTRSRQFTKRCCRSSHYASCGPTTPARTGQLWPACTFANC